MSRRAPSSEPIEIRQPAPGRIELAGPLEFETARAAHARGLEAIGATTAPQLEVDCSGITRSDSAALAVLIDWMAEARERQLRMRVVNVPEHLRAIARISEVDRLFDEAAG